MFGTYGPRVASEKRSPLLVRLEAGTLGGHTGNRGSLAPRRIPLVLDADLQGQEAPLAKMLAALKSAD